MTVYLVSYDLNTPGQKHQKLLEAIKKYPGWARISESCYAIKTNSTVQAVYDALAAIIDRNDQLYIITLSKPWTGFGPKEVNEWLDSNL